MARDLCQDGQQSRVSDVIAQTFQWMSNHGIWFLNPRLGP
jgi:hypothetical protein